MICSVAVSFDCAGTLLETRWDPAIVTLEATRTMGLEIPENVAIPAFNQLLQSRWHSYCQVNETRDQSRVDQWWTSFALDWGSPYGLSGDEVRILIRIAMDRLGSCLTDDFRVYPDVIPALEKLTARGFHLMVISNWDISLHRVLEAHGLLKYFRRAYASLVEGVEKPDPRLFEIALREFRLDASKLTHIGDDPLDDLQGARNAKVHGVLLDRSKFRSENGVFANLIDFADTLCRS